MGSSVTLIEMRQPALADVKAAETQELKAAIVAAIHHDGLAGDIGGTIRGQPYDGVGDLTRLA